MAKEQGLSDLEALLGATVSGKSFLELECLGRPQIQLSPQALGSGALSVTICDSLNSEEPLWQSTRRRFEREQLEVELISSSLPGLAERRPRRRFDVVFALDIIVHLRDPLGFLSSLAAITRETVVVTTPVILPFRERMPNGSVFGFEHDDVRCSTDLRGAEAMALAAHLWKRGIDLEQLLEPEAALVDEDGLRVMDGMWWWFWTPDGFEKIARLAGLAPKDRINLWEGKACAFLLGVPGHGFAR